MATNAGFKRRMFEALLALSQSEGEMVKQNEVMRRLGERGVKVTGAAVNRWFKGRRPACETIEALGEVLGVDPGWLAFGEKSGAEGPVLPPQAVPVPRGQGRKRKEG